MLVYIHILYYVPGFGDFAGGDLLVEQDGGTDEIDTRLCEKIVVRAGLDLPLEALVGHKIR
jgi:hypothetical protein